MGTQIDTASMARKLGCCAATIRTMAKAGTIPSLRVGRHFRFDVDAVLAALAVKGAQQAPGKLPGDVASDR